MTTGLFLITIVFLLSSLISTILSHRLHSLGLSCLYLFSYRLVSDLNCYLLLQIIQKMFGQPSTFGGGGFGQPQQQQQQPGGFGSSPFGGGGFGQPQQPPQQQQPTGFGSTSTPFGSSAGGGGGFGQPSAGSPFGGTGGGGGFGQPSTGFGGTSTFGAPAPASGGLFGSAGPAPSAFGTTSTAFGAAPGTTSGGLFGSTTSTNTGGGGLFGSAAPATNTTPFGGGSAFGSSAGGGGFGGSTFGSTTSTFGAPAPTSGLFGSTPAPAPFGAPAPTGGLFGSPAPAPSGGLFGAPSSQPLQGVGVGGPGTRTTPWQPTSRQDGSASISIHAITAMPNYEHSSAEELRVQDYQQGNRGSTTPTASNTSGGAFGFGAAPAPAFGAAPSGGLFGAAPAPAFGAPAPSAFGAPAPSGGLFGSAPSTFGAPAPASGGLFGSVPAPAPFGAPASGGLFGSTPAPAPFGAPAPAPGGLFGSTPAPAPFGAPATSPFGAPAPSAFGAPAPTGGFFGSAPAPSAFGSSFGAAPAPSGGLFGSAPAPGAFGAPAPGAFGFGAKPPGTSIFGSPQPAPAPFGSTFGTFGQAPAPFGAPSAFGQAPAQPQFASPNAMMMMPQQQQPLQQQILPPNATIIPPVENEVLEHSLRALENSRRELEKTQFPSLGGGASSLRNGVSPSTPTNLSDRGGSSPILPPGGRFAYTPFATTSPGSATKIRPRGAFPKTEPSKRTTATSLPALGGLGMSQITTRTPEAHLRTAATNLVIRPGSSRNPLKLRLESSFPSPSSDARPPRRTGETTPAEELTATPTAGEESAAPVRATREPSPRHPEPSPTPNQRHAMTNGGSEPRRPDPPKSPAYDYYQRVIGSGEETSLLSSKPQTPATPKGTTSSLPKLTKNGYTVSPSLEELAGMSEADLAAVEGFTVKRASYGKIEWEGAVDVRGADLDSIIEIQQSDISVYHDNELNGNKPPVGSKLNRPAVLTFYGVFPKKGGAAASEKAKAKLREKLEKVSKSAGATFLSYDDNIGEWKIRVQHFSRYGLLDDDSEGEDGDQVDLRDDDADDEFHRRRVRIESPTPASIKKPRMDRRQATPYRPPGRYSLSEEEMDYSESEGVDDVANRDDAGEDGFEEEDDDLDGTAGLVNDIDFTETDINEVVKAHANIAYQEVFASITKQSFVPKQDEPAVYQESKQQIITFEDEGEEESEVDDTMSDASLEQVFDSQPIERSTCRELAQKANVTASVFDHGLRAGRSCRVAWLPNGSFFKIDPRASRREPTLIQCKPIFAEDISLEKADCLLDAQLRYGNAMKSEDNACPLYSLPRGLESVESTEDLYQALKDFASVRMENQDAASAFELMAQLLFAVEDTTTEGIAEFVRERSHSPMAPRAITSLTNWLANICSDDVENEVTHALSHGDAPMAILAALSSGDVERACEAAIEAGAFDLATVLSTAADTKEDVLNQLLALSDSGSSSRIANGVLRCLKIIGGDTFSESDLYQRGSSKLDWRRHLAIRCLQSPDSTLADLVARFEEDIEKGEIPPPLPLYGKGCNSTETSLLYKLVRCLSRPSSMEVQAIVDPKGFTFSVHDFSLPFHLATALSAMKSDGAMEETFAEGLAYGYEAQLISLGLWDWAVFVSLCTMSSDVPDYIRAAKVRRAKSIILQHFDDNEDSRRRRAFLEKKVEVPSEWFEEALAGRYAFYGNVIRTIEHTLAYNCDEAVKLVEVDFLPELFLIEKGSIESRVGLLERVAPIARPDSMVVAMCRLIGIGQEMAKLGQMGAPEANVVLSSLLEDCEGIEQTFQCYRSKPRRTHGVGATNGSDATQLSEMITDALKTVNGMKNELRSYASSRGMICSM